jgi:hypothetical protein
LASVIDFFIKVLEKIAELTGIPLGKFLKDFGITFINLDDTVLLPFDHYFVFSTSPVFNI